MKTLAIRNGDLVIGPEGHLVIDGASKVRQEIGLTLREPVGVDRFHREWGSMLPNYIGEPIQRSTGLLVETETTRVVQNYVAQQANVLERDSIGTRRSRLNANEVIGSLNGVRVRQDQDKIHVKIEMTMLSRRRESIVASVGG
jgi:phage baseplate assembly protein W